MSRPLWTPSADRIARANMTRFGGGRSYADLYAWSVEKPLEFWDTMWDFAGVHGSKGQRIAADLDRMPGARFFPDATLNFAENVLARGHDDEPAILCKTETTRLQSMSWWELRAEVAAFASALPMGFRTVAERASARAIHRSRYSSQPRAACLVQGDELPT